MARTSYRYVHKPLDPDSIRLVELLPGNYDDRIECRLSHHVFDDDLSYEGVSYTWGDPSRKVSIVLNGYSFRIRRNLFYCLRRLRHTEKSLFLWIDAICIHQSNTNERNHNVGMMDDIYSQAKRVYVWLGEGDKRSDLAMSFLQQKFPTAFVPRYFVDENDLDGWYAVSKLFDHSYWTRLWVVQEFVLARDIVLICGGKRANCTPVVNATESMIRMYDAALKSDAIRDASTWTAHKDVLRLIRESHAIKLMVYRAQNNVGIDSRWSSRRKIYMRPLSDLLDNFHSSGCTDVRDYLYAMLSLASDFYHVRKRVVDYSLSKTSLLYNVIAHYNHTYSSEGGLEYRELKAIAHLCVNFNIQIPERYGHYAFITHPNSYLELKSRIVKAAIRIHVDSFCTRRLSSARLLQEAGQVSRVASAETQFNSIRWDVNVDDSGCVSYHDILNAGESPSRDTPSTEDLPKLLICINEIESTERRVFETGLICSAAREGDLLFTRGCHSHIGLVFRKSKNNENKYTVVGTAMYEQVTESDLLQQGSTNGQSIQVPIMLGEPESIIYNPHTEFWLDIPMLLKLIQYLHRDDMSEKFVGAAHTSASW